MATPNGFVGSLLNNQQKFDKEKAKCCYFFKVVLKMRRCGECWGLAGERRSSGDWGVIASDDQATAGGGCVRDQATTEGRDCMRDHVEPARVHVAHLRIAELHCSGVGWLRNAFNAAGEPKKGLGNEKTARRRSSPTPKEKKSLKAPFLAL